MSVRIKLRRDTSANWKTVNPVPVEGEPCFETDTGKLKIGDGINPYNSLAYFAGGGGGGTDISASLPLVIEDGVLKLQIDGQTIQLNTEGQLSANLDEIGNEVNALSNEVTTLSGSVTTLSGDVEDISDDVAALQAGIAAKQDKLTTLTPLKIDVVPNARLVGFTVNTQNHQIKANEEQSDVMQFGDGKGNTIDPSQATSYIKIPYTIGQILRLPFKPTSRYQLSESVNETAMLPGWFGHTNEDGSVYPVMTGYMQSTTSDSSGDTYMSGYFNNFQKNSAGTFSARSAGIESRYPGTPTEITGDSSLPVVCVQLFNPDSFDIQFPSEGYKNPNYSVLWVSKMKTYSDDYSTIDCFIYCPPGQEYIDQNLFGLYQADSRYGTNNMLDYTKTATNLLSFEGSDLQYLQLDIGNGLAVVDGVLTATAQTPTNMVTTDTAQDITGVKNFKSGIVADGYVNSTGLSDLAYTDTNRNPHVGNVNRTLTIHTNPTLNSRILIDDGTNTYYGLHTGNLTAEGAKATTDSVGLVKPDGTSITVADDGTISAVSSGSSGDVTAAGDNTFTGANTFTGINTFDKIVLPNKAYTKGIFLEGNNSASISGSNGKMTIRHVSSFTTESCKIESGHLKLGDYEDIGVEAIVALYEKSDGLTREVNLLTFYNATASLSLGDSSIPLNIEGSTIEVNGNDLTKIIDGQWVPVNITVAENITYPTEAETEYDLSSFLPTDTYDYEVLIRGYVRPSATANKYVNLYIGSPLLGIKAGITGTRTQGAYVAENVGSCIIPVDTTRKIQVATSTSANAEGSYTIWACAYRRIGTNA